MLLIDDIITTGATASACALALLQAGAVEVTAVAIAAAEELPKSRKSPLRQNPKKTEAACPEIMGVPLRYFYSLYELIRGHLRTIRYAVPAQRQPCQK